MKKIANVTITIFLFYFSFYYTKIILDYIKDQDPLMQEIKKQKGKFEKKATEAIIVDNTIIPGLTGIQVDIDESYQKMKKIGTYNESLFVFKVVKPKISLEQIPNKLIISGNSKIPKVSFLIKVDDFELLKQITQEFPTINIILEADFFNQYLEYLKKIPNQIVVHETSNLIINKRVDYCYSTLDFKNNCQKFHKLTIYPIIIDHDYYYHTYKIIENGKIIGYQLKNEKQIKEFLTLKQGMENLGYQIVSLKELLKE